MAAKQTLSRSKAGSAGAPADGLDALVVLGILRTAKQLNPLLDSDLRELDLTGSQVKVLLLLLHAAQDEPLSLSDVGRQLVVTKANVTGLVDRLERKGLVRRASGTDRRVFFAQLTPQGRALVDRIHPRHQLVLESLTHDLSRKEKEQLVQTLTKLRKTVRTLLPHHAGSNRPSVSRSEVTP